MNPEARSRPGLMGKVLEGIYRIDGMVGEGGMGTVYEAVHLRLSKRVALKVMVRELAANSEALARFHREAVVTSGLGHPHIVQVFDFSTTPTGEPFFVMEFLEGEDLDRRIRREGRLSFQTAVHIVKQVASALAAAHTKKVVHRDLKPANIRLLDLAGESDFVKVLDFGISKVRGAAGTALTQSTAIIGTPNYMSPEQAMGRIDEIDSCTDQWALACIAWECLSGAPPFVGENAPSVLFQVVHEEPPPLSKKMNCSHPQVEAVLRHALAKDKSGRFASIESFAAAFEEALLGKPMVEKVSAPASPYDTVEIPEPRTGTGLDEEPDESARAPDTSLSPVSALWSMGADAFKRPLGDGGQTEVGGVARRALEVVPQKTVPLVDTVHESVQVSPKPWSPSVGPAAHLPRRTPAEFAPPQPVPVPSCAPTPLVTQIAPQWGWVHVLGLVVITLATGALLMWVLGPRPRSVVESVVVTPAHYTPWVPNSEGRSPVFPARIESTTPSAPKAASSRTKKNLPAPLAAEPPAESNPKQIQSPAKKKPDGLSDILGGTGR